MRRYGPWRMALSSLAEMIHSLLRPLRWQATRRARLRARGPGASRRPACIRALTGRAIVSSPCLMGRAQERHRWLSVAFSVLGSAVAGGSSSTTPRGLGGSGWGVSLGWAYAPEGGGGWAGSALRFRWSCRA